MIYLKLTQPFDPGSYDKGNTYPDAFISVFNMDAIAQVIEVRWEYGTFDPSVGWLSGKASVTQVAHIQNEDFYSAIAAKADPESDDSVLMSAARQAYNYLIAKGLADGTVTEGVVKPPPAQDVATSDAATFAPADDTSAESPPDAS
ncbi:MAG: hypothetical protein EOO38_01795 [Cytophagaceae bacterium]|nr:MAG: hypothetical protein EOO38_01795 [Cytophagaceae bacterium]